MKTAMTGKLKEGSDTIYLSVESSATRSCRAPERNRKQAVAVRTLEDGGVMVRQG